MNLNEMIQKPTHRAAVITLCADAGLGKTSLAATFPEPLFIRAEDGMQSIPINDRPDALPKIKKVEDLWKQLEAVIRDDHEYKTLVIDSVTALERLFESYIVNNDPKKPASINQAEGGFGNGYKAVAALHRKLRNYCELLVTRKGMHVVFIAHADTEKIDLPDSEPYSRYSMRLCKQSVPVYLDDSDLVGYIKLESFVKTAENGPGKAKSTGKRLLVASAEASTIAKNRYGIDKEIPLNKGENR